MAATQEYVLMADLQTNSGHNEAPIDSAEVLIEPEVRGGMGYKRACCSSPHLKSWFLSIGFWFSIALKAVCFLWRDQLCECSGVIVSNWQWNWDWGAAADQEAICTQPIYNSFGNDIENVCRAPCNFAMAWVFFALLGPLYFLYLMETCCSSSRRYLSNSGVKETVYQYVDRVKSYPPSIKWWVECYHYETRTRTYRDSNGNTHTETYQEKVVTWSNQMYYQFRSWSDISGLLHGLEDYKLVKITYSKRYTFANEATRQDYQEQWDRFKRENNRDTYQDAGEVFTIRDYTKKMLSEVEPGVKPKCLSLGWFLCWSCIGCTSCYRSWFGAIVGDRKKFTFCKQINIY